MDSENTVRKGAVGLWFRDDAPLGEGEHHVTITPQIMGVQPEPPEAMNYIFNVARSIETKPTRKSSVQPFMASDHEELKLPEIQHGQPELACMVPGEIRRLARPGG
jgi:hypothetical protein